MPKPTGPTNPVLRGFIVDLKSKGYEGKNDFLLNLAKLLGRSNRNKVGVNLSKVNRYAADGETVLIPGKVLSSGLLGKKVTVAGWSFSSNSMKKIEDAGGKVLTVQELVESNPKGTGVRILK